LTRLRAPLLLGETAGTQKELGKDLFQLRALLRGKGLACQCEKLQGYAIGAGGYGGGKMLGAHFAARFLYTPAFTKTFRVRFCPLPFG
jgi:hypothetical protein